jgi:hypothetical protein
MPEIPRQSAHRGRRPIAIRRVAEIMGAGRSPSQKRFDDVIIGKTDTER